MKRLGLLLGAASLWLVIFATPALADGGPHVASVNNGTAGLSADSCAGCHRAHTAQAANLLSNDVEHLCLNCHDGSKATTDVVDGVQYSAADKTQPVLGALRSGGFTYALINSASPARLSYTSVGRLRFTAHVGVLATGQNVTSTHGGDGTVWGNGAVNSGTGASVTLDCTSCHNPHGNGLYRILQTKPGGAFSAGSGFQVSIAHGVEVQDVAAAGLRNYTILPSPDGLASNIVGTSSQGDYWRIAYDPTGVRTWSWWRSGADEMNAGWDGALPTNAADNGGAAPQNADGLMTAWCLQCHTRYSGLPTLTYDPNTDTYTGGNSALFAMQPEDSTFMYKHPTDFRGCEQCHVAHGSNALMAQTSDGSTNSLDFTDPNGDVPAKITNAGATHNLTSGDSRLLKVDNRGTCELCHDPTKTVPAGQYDGPLPMPGL